MPGTLDGDLPASPERLLSIASPMVFFIVSSPGVPQYAVRTQRPRRVRVPSTYCTWGPGGKPPCASGTYTTREAGTRSLYVPNGGAGAYVSAQASAKAPDDEEPASDAAVEQAAQSEAEVAA